MSGICQGAIGNQVTTYRIPRIQSRQVPWLVTPLIPIELRVLLLAILVNSEWIDG